MVNPRTGSARRLTRGGASSPSWSPDGRRLAVVRRGWIELVGSSGGRLRRLTRGGAPAWSPNGEQLAFVGAHDRLFVIAARGGKPRPVGQIRAGGLTGSRSRASLRARAKLPPTQGCGRVAGRHDQHRSRAGPRSPFSVLGCLTSDGRERLLESGHQIYYTGFWVGAVALAGDYAALVNETSDGHYGGTDDTVAVFDLRTGTRVAGGESVGCAEWSSGSTGPCDSGIDQLVLGTDGDTAAHTFVFNNPLGPSCQSVEQIVANDSTGTHVLDSITTTTPYSYTDPRGCDSPAAIAAKPAVALRSHAHLEPRRYPGKRPAELTLERCSARPGLAITPYRKGYTQEQLSAVRDTCCHEWAGASPPASMSSPALSVRRQKLSAGVAPGRCCVSSASAA